MAIKLSIAEIEAELIEFAELALDGLDQIQPDTPLNRTMRKLFTMRVHTIQQLTTDPGEPNAFVQQIRRKLPLVLAQINDIIDWLERLEPTAFDRTWRNRLHDRADALVSTLDGMRALAA